IASKPAPTDDRNPFVGAGLLATASPRFQGETATRTTRVQRQKTKTITTDPGGASKASPRFRTSEICRFSGADTP
ncbi:MAG: hypothetical protein ABWZ65_08405, partial [Pseudomonas mandelii]